MVVRSPHRARVVHCYAIDAMNGLEASTEPGAIQAGRMHSIQAYRISDTSRQVHTLTCRSDFPSLLPRCSFHRKGCPAGVADAWTLACKGPEWSVFR